MSSSILRINYGCNDSLCLIKKKNRTKKIQCIVTSLAVTDCFFVFFLNKFKLFILFEN